MGFQISVKAIPAKTLNIKAVRREVQKALDETGKVLQKEFAKTTEAWEGAKPNFAVTTGAISTMGGGRAFVRCYPAGDEEGVEKWVRLDEGTKPHVIRPRNKKYLRFPWRGYKQSYDPGTVRYWLGSMSHRKLGTITSFNEVNHPGNEPRDWSIVLGEKEIGPFAERIWAAVQRGLAEK